jgi:hypothetical protein
MTIGRIVAVTSRHAGEARRRDHAGACEVNRAGLLGDIHADIHSPRQLLLADAAVYDAFCLPAHALRENLLVDVDTARLVSGTVLRLGREVSIRLMFQCEACGALDRERPGLSRAIGGRRGMLARVVTGGIVRYGDSIDDLGVLMPAWPDEWRDRVRQVLDAVPPGCVIEYTRLARLAGIQSSYCRAFPRLIASFGADHAAKAVSARSTTTLPRWDGAGLFDAS